jgi:hypothetical protein
MGVTLDWRERPAVSPQSGFFIQARTGHTGNFEVVIPWPDGGLAHYWRDNDNPDLPWHGPTLFAQGSRYVAAALVESDFTSFVSSSLNNLEVVATREDGALEHWWRENGGLLVWSKSGVLFNNVVGAPAITYSGAVFKEGFFSDRESHEDGYFHIAAPLSGGGFECVGTSHPPMELYRLASLDWSQKFGGDILLDRKFVGVSIARTTLNNPTPKASWKEMREYTESARGKLLAAVVSDQGALNVYEYGALPNTPTFEPEHGWCDGLTVTQPTEFGDILRPFRGRPCLMQGDYGLREDSWIPLDRAHYGNLELMAPGKDGGILHFCKDNGEATLGVRLNLHEGWSFATKIGSSEYDEVSFIQSNFGDADHGPLEMIARRREQRGFDFFWRNDELVWGGPISVSSPGVVAQPFVVMPLDEAMSLARSHLASSDRLADVPLAAEAVTAAQTAVDVLHGVEPPLTARAEYLTLLAKALHAVVQRLMQGGRPAEVARPAREAVQVYRQAASVSAGESVMELSTDLLTLTQWLADALLAAEAVTAAQTAVDVLHGVEPPLTARAEYLTLLAKALHDLAKRLVQAGRPDEATQPTEDAVQAEQQAALLN